MASSALTFKLNDEFITKVASWPDPFEGNALGKFVYDRTYSRYKADDTLETWADTCRRVVEGCYTLQKEHIEKHDLGWDDEHGQYSAQEMFERLYTHKFLASGRALWCLGTDVVHQRELDMALFNCSFISTKDLDKNASMPFKFLMDVSMLGVGCGFDTKGANKVRLYQPEIPANQLALNYYTIIDSREGWVNSVGALVDIYTRANEPDIIFNYSEIRPEGAKLKTFGGKACGSKPLEDLHCKIRGVFERDLKQSGYLTSVGIVDIFNLIGCCVVAGNIRRCLPKGTLVHLTRGLVNIEDVVDGDNVITSNGVHKVVGFLEQGEQELATIVTQLGETSVSLRHKQKVFTDINTYEFKMAQDLRPGDRLVFSDHIIPGTETKMPDWHYEKPISSTTCKDLTIPTLDEDMAWFLGYLLGDGYVYPNWEKNGCNAYVGFAFHPEYSDMLTKCRAQMDRFGVTTRIINTNKERDQSIRLNAQSKQLAWYLSKFKVANESLDVPSEIMTAMPNIRASFLAGVLDADGSTKGRPLQALSSVYPKFVKQLQCLYATLGIPTRMKLHREQKGVWQPLYHLNVVGQLAIDNFIERVSQYSLKCKLNPVESKRSQNDFGFPSGWITNSDLKYGRHWSPNSDQMTMATFIKCGGTYDKCIPIEVTELRIDGKRAETYDLSVKDVHEFIYDEGLYTSNTAEIAFGEEDDKEFLDLKNYEKNPHRASYGWTSNNSIFARIGMDYTDSAKRVAINGEPGFAWLENMRGYGRMCDPPDSKDHRVMGGNPCFPDDTPILTSEGIKEIKELIGKKFTAVLNGQEYESDDRGFYQTGTNKQLFKMELENGMTLRATPNHLINTDNGMVELEKLSVGDTILLSDNTGYRWQNTIGTFDEGYLIGWIIGDGTFYTNPQGVSAPIINMWINSKYDEPEKYEPYKFIQEQLMKFDTRSDFKGLNLARTEDAYNKYRANCTALTELTNKYGVKALEKKVYEKGSYDFTRGMLQALFDTDGTVLYNQQKGNSIRISQVHLERLEAIQRLLNFMGINSVIYKNRDCGGMRPMPDGHGGTKEYQCKPRHELVIAKRSIRKFYDAIGFKDNDKKYKLEQVIGSYTKGMYADKYVSKVKLITQDTSSDVFDCTIPDGHIFTANCIQVHNCLEIGLESAELCNLVETVPIKHDSLEDFLRTIKYAYLFAKTVTLRSLHWPETTRVVLRNRRIGTSVTGIAQFLSKYDMETLRVWLDGSYKEIRKWDSIYSDWFCIPRSIKVTAIKPSGTLSILAGVSPGCHFPESKYYIRRVRVANGSHLIPGLKSKGFHLEPCVGCEDTTSVVEIPIYIGEVKTIDDVTMWEQLELAAFLQHWYADNQVSCTVTFNQKTEGQHIAAALNTYQYKLKGISFLPRFESSTAYPQMPYEKISKEKYYTMIDKQRSIQFEVPSNKLKRKRTAYEEMPDAVTYCDGEKCMI